MDTSSYLLALTRAAISHVSRESFRGGGVGLTEAGEVSAVAPAGGALDAARGDRALERDVHVRDLELPGGKRGGQVY